MAIQEMTRKSMTKDIITFILVLFPLSVVAQTFADRNLSVVVIETDDGTNIPDDPKVLAAMKIIWQQDGSRYYLTDVDNPELLRYDGRIDIEQCCSLLQTMFNKKPYDIETRKDDGVISIINRKVRILGMPVEIKTCAKLYCNYCN